MLTRAPLRLAVLLAPLAGACAPSPPRGPLAPPDAEPPPAVPLRPAGAGDLEPLRADGAPVAPGRPMSLAVLRLSCAAGPEPGLDNEDPAASAEERFVVELDLVGWASVTLGVHAVLWDGRTESAGGPHAVAFAAARPLAQMPARGSAEPYERDAYRLAIPVVAPELIQAAAGTSTPCTLDGAPAPDRHDLLVCATDARDLASRACWFCGPHLDAPSLPPGAAVGRLATALVPDAPPFEATESVVCAYTPRTQSP